MNIAALMATGAVVPVEGATLAPQGPAGFADTMAAFVPAKPEAKAPNAAAPGASSSPAVAIKPTPSYELLASDVIATAPLTVTAPRDVILPTRSLAQAAAPASTAEARPAETIEAPQAAPADAPRDAPAATPLAEPKPRAAELKPAMLASVSETAIAATQPRPAKVSDSATATAPSEPSQPQAEAPPPPVAPNDNIRRQPLDTAGGKTESSTAPKPSSGPSAPSAPELDVPRAAQERVAAEAGRPASQVQAAPTAQLRTPVRLAQAQEAPAGAAEPAADAPPSKPERPAAVGAELPQVATSPVAPRPTAPIADKTIPEAQPVLARTEQAATPSRIRQAPAEASSVATARPVAAEATTILAKPDLAKPELAKAEPAKAGLAKPDLAKPAIGTQGLSADQPDEVDADTAPPLPATAGNDQPVQSASVELPQPNAAPAQPAPPVNAMPQAPISTALPAPAPAAASPVANAPASLASLPDVAAASAAGTENRAETARATPRRRSNGESDEAQAGSEAMPAFTPAQSHAPQTGTQPQTRHAAEAPPHQPSFKADASPGDDRTALAPASGDAAPAAIPAPAGGDKPAQPAAAQSFASLVDGTTPVAQAPAPSPAATTNAASVPTVNARPGQIGQELGVEVARRVSVGKDELLVRLNPEHMGRIEVRMTFDNDGTLRAVVQADSPAALDMLRRDSGDLARALTDAGIRSDSQSFRFDTRGGDGGQPRQQPQGQRNPDQFTNADSAPNAQEVPEYRRVRTNGNVDLLA